MAGITATTLGTSGIAAAVATSDYNKLAVGFRQLGVTFDTASHSAENCMSALVSDFKCLVDSVESQVSTVQWCYTKKTLNNICSVLNELSTKCETIYCHT